MMFAFAEVKPGGRVTFTTDLFPARVVGEIPVTGKYITLEEEP